LLRLTEREGLTVSLIIGARTNEWNVAGQDLDPLIKDDYELRDLNEREVAELLEKLERYHSLGDLDHLTPAQRADRFKFHAERQLLIALHEATTGKPFEEIVFDEYERIVPLEARVLYLDICTLHRLGVPVRAGLVSRVSGITFDYFKSKLFSPLEHVVRTYYDTGSRDFVYRTRHSLIAEFVFRQALPDPIERAAQIKRIIRHMDVDYESDAEAFRQLVKGRTLADLFADKALVWEIFDAAIESGAAKSFILQQKAIFELNHPGGNLRHALDAITDAEAHLRQPDRSIQHTKAMIYRRLALESDQPLERERLRNEARQILRKLQSQSRVPHPFNTFAQLLVDEVKDRFKLWNATGQEVSELEKRGVTDLIRQAEEALFNGLQKFPGDEYLLALDAELAQLLHDEPRAIESLRAAFQAHPGRAFVAVRLARFHAAAGEVDEARRTLEASLAANPTSKECHLELATLYGRSGEEANKDAIGYHLKRSFTEGDSNFAAQTLCARHEFLYGDRAGALDLFRKLREARTSSSDKKTVRGIVLDADGNAIVHSGYIKALHSGYCFASCPDLNCDIFIPARSMSEEEWGKVQQGSAVKFKIGFSMQGPIGADVRLVQ
jgi:hypothetical protein